MIFTNIERTILHCPCENSGTLKDQNIFEPHGIHNGYPIVICKKCARLIAYKAPISWLKIIGFGLLILSIISMLSGESGENLLFSFGFSIGFIILGSILGKEIEIVGIAETNEEENNNL